MPTILLVAWPDARKFLHSTSGSTPPPRPGGQRRLWGTITDQTPLMVDRRAETGIDRSDPRLTPRDGEPRPAARPMIYSAAWPARPLQPAARCRKPAAGARHPRPPCRLNARHEGDRLLPILKNAEMAERPDRARPWPVPCPTDPQPYPTLRPGRLCSPPPGAGTIIAALPDITMLICVAADTQPPWLALLGSAAAGHRRGGQTAGHGLGLARMSVLDGFPTDRRGQQAGNRRLAMTASRSTGKRLTV